MNIINYDQLRKIRAKLLLGLALTAFEKAYYTLYGYKLNQQENY